MVKSEELHPIDDKSSSPHESSGSDWVGELYDLFTPVRQYVLESGMTEDEVNQIIDEAIKEVREERKRRQNLENR